MTIEDARFPVDPSRRRTDIAEIYASLPRDLQYHALGIVDAWPRLIHTLACAGELATPRFDETLETSP
ncbi:MAG: hypothetical protein WDM79_02400 [Terricaulis sp.]